MVVVLTIAALAAAAWYWRPIPVSVEVVNKTSTPLGHLHCVLGTGTFGRTEFNTKDVLQREETKIWEVSITRRPNLAVEFSCLAPNGVFRVHSSTVKTQFRVLRFVVEDAGVNMALDP